jgi:hypothetical protein
MPDTMKGAEAFGVDHYRPKSLFPALQTRYENLFYACNPCNRRKGQYWPASDRETSHFIPNPCSHKMHAHLRFSRGAVRAASVAGRVALELLDLNDPEAVAFREFILELIDTSKRELRQVEQTTAVLRRRLRRNASSEMRAEIQILEAARGRITQRLNRLGGVP